MKKQYTAPVLHAQRQCGNHRKITNRVCEITKRLCEFSQAIALVIEWASDALDDNLDDPSMTRAIWAPPVLFSGLWKSKLPTRCSSSAG